MAGKSGLGSARAPLAAIATAAFGIVLLHRCSTGYWSMAPAEEAVAVLERSLQYIQLAKHGVEERLRDGRGLAASNREAYIDDHDALRPDDIEFLNIHPGGVIEIRFRRWLGVEHGTVHLIPDVSNAGTPVITRWRCTSPDIEKAGYYLDDCRYDKDASYSH